MNTRNLRTHRKILAHIVAHFRRMQNATLTTASCGRSGASNERDEPLDFAVGTTRFELATSAPPGPLAIRENSVLLTFSFSFHRLDRIPPVLLDHWRSVSNRRAVFKMLLLSDCWIRLRFSGVPFANNEFVSQQRLRYTNERRKKGYRPSDQLDEVAHVSW